MAFEPSWGSKYSKYDPKADVPIKRAKEIFPQDFINLFLAAITEATTAKVARVTIKDLAKKNGGKAGLHDLFLSRPLDLAKQMTARQLKFAEKTINQLRKECAKHVVLSEHKRRLAFGAAIRIGVYVRGYIAKKLTQKRRVQKEKKIRDDNAASKVQGLVRGVQARCRFEEIVGRAFLWQKRGRKMRYLEKAIVKETRHVRNDPNESRICFLLALEDGTRWEEHIIGVTVTCETAPNLIDPNHPEGGRIQNGETAVLFAHYGIMPSGGRRAPVVICRVDMKPSTRLEESRLAIKRAEAAAADKFGGSKKKQNKSKSPGRGNKRGKKKGKKGSSFKKKKATEEIEVIEDIVKVPAITSFDESTSPIQYLQMVLGGQALPASFQGYRGQRLERNEREEFYVLQHMSGFLGRDLVRYLGSRRELPALASPDGSGQDGKWAKDRRRKYWEEDNARHQCILPYRRRMYSVLDKKYKEQTIQRIKKFKTSTFISPLWESTAPSNVWRLIFFEDDGVLNFEDTLRGGSQAPQARTHPETGHVTMTKYNMTTDPFTLDEERVHRLVTIANEVGARLICCSNRRETHALTDQLTETLHNAGLPLTSFLGFTSKLDRPASGTSRRLAEVYTWLLEQDPRRVIESWVIVDKIDLARGDARDRVMLWNARKLRPIPLDKKAGDDYDAASEKGWAGKDINIHNHFVRTHLRKGLNEERGNELRRLLLLPKNQLKEDIESDLIERKQNFQERSEAFLNGMPKEGPFVVGLKTKEQNRRLELFRKVFGELVEDMNYLDRGFKQLRSIVDGDSFLESDFKWDSGKHRKVKSTTKQINDAWQKLENTRSAHENRHKEIVCLKKGGRFCPKCATLVHAPPDFTTNAESNKWLSCTSKNCLFEFCSRCGANKIPIINHGMHRHVLGCQFHKKLRDGIKEKPMRYWSAVTSEVKKGKKKAGDVRCKECIKMPIETEPCHAPTDLPESWAKEKDPDPKLKRIRNALKEEEKLQRARNR